MAKNIVESCKESYENGTMTMRQVQEELCHAHWFNYLPSEEQVKALFGLF